MRRLILAALASSLATPCLAGPRVFPVAVVPDMVDHYPVQVARWPGGVTSLADVTYSVISGYRPLVVDIYMPPRRGGPKPLVLYIHGGGWIAGHTRHSGALANFPGVLAKLASEGFVVASLEYRLAGEAPFPAQLQDARAALRFLKGNAARYGIDPSRTGIWGGSAGGHLAALTALTCGMSDFDPPGTVTPAGSECVQAAVTWYGVFDFAAHDASKPGGEPATPLLLGCARPCPPERYAQVSPNSYIDAADPPFLLIHGTEDKTVAVSQSREAEAKMKAAGMTVESVYISGVDHSYLGKTPAETRTATHRAVNATFDYFHRLLDRRPK